MLYKLHHNIFIIGLLTISLICCWTNQSAFDLMAMGTLVAFVSQMALLLFFVRDDNGRYTETTLFVTVFAYQRIGMPRTLRFPVLTVLPPRTRKKPSGV